MPAWVQLDAWRSHQLACIMSATAAQLHSACPAVPAHPLLEQELLYTLLAVSHAPQPELLLSGAGPSPALPST